MSKTTTSSKKTKALGKAPVVAADPEKRIIKHNKKFPVIKSNRTEMTKKLLASGGKFITTTHVDKDGNLRTMNCVVPGNAKKELGYVTVTSVKEGKRNVNTQTLTDISVGGVHYVAPKPKVKKAELV